MEIGKFFITRKRKKWKFAHFNSWENCFNASEVSSDTWKQYFQNDNQIILEIGAGTADLSIKLAQQYPNCNFVAIDVKSDRLYTGAKYALKHNMRNIVFVRTRISKITDIFTRGSVQEIWITFPDPYSRKKQAKHRLTHVNFLQKYRNLLSKTGSLKLKTDNQVLFLWSLEQLVENNWHIEKLNFDLHKSNLSEDYKLTTTYERRFMAEGKAINFVVARP